MYKSISFHPFHSFFYHPKFQISIFKSEISRSSLCQAVKVFNPAKALSPSSKLQRQPSAAAAFPRAGAAVMSVCACATPRGGHGYTLHLFLLGIHFLPSPIFSSTVTSHPSHLSHFFPSSISSFFIKRKIYKVRAVRSSI